MGSHWGRGLGTGGMGGPLGTRTPDGPGTECRSRAAPRWTRVRGHGGCGVATIQCWNATRAHQISLYTRIQTAAAVAPAGTERTASTRSERGGPLQTPGLAKNLVSHGSVIAVQGHRARPPPWTPPPAGLHGIIIFRAGSEFAGPMFSWRQIAAALGRPHCQDNISEADLPRTQTNNVL